MDITPKRKPRRAASLSPQRAALPVHRPATFEECLREFESSANADNDGGDLISKWQALKKSVGDGNLADRFDKASKNAFIALAKCVTYMPFEHESFGQVLQTMTETKRDDAWDDVFRSVYVWENERMPRVQRMLGPHVKRVQLDGETETDDKTASAYYFMVLRLLQAMTRNEVLARRLLLRINQVARRLLLKINQASEIELLLLNSIPRRNLLLEILRVPDVCEKTDENYKERLEFVTFAMKLYTHRNKRNDEPMNWLHTILQKYPEPYKTMCARKNEHAAVRDALRKWAPQRAIDSLTLQEFVYVVVSERKGAFEERFKDLETLVERLRYHDVVAMQETKTWKWLLPFLIYGIVYGKKKWSLSRGTISVYQDIVAIIADELNFKKPSICQALTLFTAEYIAVRIAHDKTEEEYIKRRIAQDETAAKYIKKRFPNDADKYIKQRIPEYKTAEYIKRHIPEDEYWLLCSETRTTLTFNEYMQARYPKILDKTNFYDLLVDVLDNDYSKDVSDSAEYTTDEYIQRAIGMLGERKSLPSLMNKNHRFYLGGKIDLLVDVLDNDYCKDVSDSAEKSLTKMGFKIEYVKANTHNLSALKPSDVLYKRLQAENDAMLKVQKEARLKAVNDMLRGSWREAADYYSKRAGQKTEAGVELKCCEAMLRARAPKWKEIPAGLHLNAYDLFVKYVNEGWTDDHERRCKNDEDLVLDLAYAAAKSGVYWLCMRCECAYLKMPKPTQRAMAEEIFPMFRLVQATVGTTIF